jgi:hypothetical protein
MSVAQEFHDVFIRISDIERIYPGGMDGYIIANNEFLGSTIWHDAYLVREGAMSSTDIETIVDSWKDLGFDCYSEKDGIPVEWLQICVSNGYAEQPTLPCSWVAYDSTTRGAFLKGTVPGKLIGPIRRV